MNTAEKERHEEARYLAQPTTPKSERRRNSYGSLLMQIPDKGCLAPRCVKQAGHGGEHWPRERN